MPNPSQERTRNDDRYARESFTLRRMHSWQAWTLAGVAVVLVVLGLLYI